jgi:hypothetical protein
VVSNGRDKVIEYNGCLVLLLVEDQPPYAQLIQINDDKLDTVIALLEAARQERRLRTDVHEP